VNKELRRIPLPNTPKRLQSRRVLKRKVTRLPHHPLHPDRAHRPRAHESGVLSQSARCQPSYSARKPRTFPIYAKLRLHLKCNRAVGSARAEGNQCQLGTQPVLSAPKTARSRGLVVLPADTVAVLRDHWRHQLEERLAAGGDYVDRGLVFCDLHGAPLSPATVSRRFERLGRAADLPR
jgi:hypothetical protein